MMSEREQSAPSAVEGPPAVGNRRWFIGATLATGLALPSLALIGNQWMRSPEPPAVRRVPQNHREEFQRFVEDLNTHLTTLRNEIVWHEHRWVQNQSGLIDVINSNARKAERLLQRKDLDGTLVLSEAQRTKLQESLTTLSDFLGCFGESRDVPPGDVRKLNQVRGCFWEMERQLKHAGAVVQKSPGASAEAKPAKFEPPLIVTIYDPLKPECMTLDCSIGATLRTLVQLGDQDKMKLTRAIVENPCTKLKRIETLPNGDCEFWINRTIDLVGGETKDIEMHFYQTIEKKNTVAAGVGALNEGGVIIRTALVEDVPVDSRLCIIGYTTCLSYFGDEKGRTELSFTADMEVAFTKMQAPTLGASAYRSGAKFKCARNVERVQVHTVGQAAQNITQIVDEGLGTLRKITLPSQQGIERPVPGRAAAAELAAGSE